MPLSRATVRATLVYFASYILIGALGGAVGPTLGPFAAQVGVGLSTIGIMLTTRSLGYLAGALSSSRVVDRIRIHRGLVGAAALAGAVLVALPWARSLGLLVLLVVPLGFATAGLDIGVSTMLLRTHRERAAPYISALHFCYGAGGFAAPFLVAALAAGRETAVYPLLAVGFAVLALAYATLPETIERSTATVTITPRTDSPAPRSEMPRRDLQVGFGLATIVILLYVGAEIGFASWLYEFVNLQFSPTAATAVTGAFWAGFTVSRLGAVFAARRYSPSRILAAAFAVGLALALLLVFSRHEIALVWIGAVGVGVAVGPIYPNVVTAYSQRYELTGKRFAAIAVASCTGSMVFPWLIGRLLDVGGPIVVPAVTAGLLVAAGAAAWIVFGRRVAAPAR